MALEGGSAVQVTHTGGLRAWESGDGLTLYIEKESPRDLWEKPTVGGPEKLIFSSTHAFRFLVQYSWKNRIPGKGRRRYASRVLEPNIDPRDETPNVHFS